MKRLTAEWILDAVKIVRDGTAQKLEKDGVTVYSCGKIVRIDVKAAALDEDDGPDDVWPDPPGEDDRRAYPACADDALDFPWY